MINLFVKVTNRLPIGLLQLIHNRTRLIAAVGGVTFANVLIFMQLGFMNALFETSVLTHRSWDTDIAIVSSDFRSLREANPVPRARMYEALSTPGVENASPVYVATMTWSNPENGDTTNFRVLGVDPDEHVFESEELQALVPKLRIADQAIVDTKTRDFNPEIARTIHETGRYPIELNGRSIDFVGTFRHGASFDVDGTLIVSDQTFLRLFPKRRSGAPTVIFIHCQPNVDIEAVRQSINERLSEEDAIALTKDELIHAEQSYQAGQTPIGFVFGFGVVIGTVVGLVIVYQVLATDVQDHLSEYATFKAIGYAPRFFLGVIFEEALCLAAFGFVPGMIISLVLYRVAANATSLPISMPISRPIFVFVLTAVMCTVSGAIATRKLNSADPADLF